MSCISLNFMMILKDVNMRNRKLDAIPKTIINNKNVCFAMYKFNLKSIKCSEK